MFEQLFLNPANIVVGGALIGSPIIIHLINRMRYRRIRWAAMEFLLKSQKRNRRRLIIEQLILLFLRILLVILAALLLARFLGFSFAGLFQPQNTLHLIVLDDRLSMNDHWKSDDGEQKNAFDNARQLIEKEIAKPASQARTPQRLVVYRLSDLTGASRVEESDEPPTPIFDQRLNDNTVKDLASTLARTGNCTALHLDLEKGVNKAGEILLDKKNAGDRRLLHVVSDFRQRQWGEPEGAGLARAVERLARDVRVNLVDAAHPTRSDVQKTPLYHDNLAIVDLRPETRVAAEGIPIQFTVSVANYSASERKGVRVTVKVEGSERAEGSLTMMSVPPGVTSQTFQIALVQPGFNQVTANLENEEVGLQEDNLRYATVEVRRQVPILLIDGDLTNGDKPGGDSYHLRAAFVAANKRYEVVRAGASELERPTLDQYPSIYLLNVRELSPAQLKNLQAYVRNGGSVAYFLGDRVNADYYNKELYANGDGVFPVPLAARPTQPLTEDEKEQRRKDGQAKVFIRDDSHPLFAESMKKERGEDSDERKFMLACFKYLIFDRYYPVPRAKWNPKPGQAEELMTLPNRRSIEDYQEEAKKLRDSLPVDDEKQKKFRPGLERHQRMINEALRGTNLFELANAFDSLLHDRGSNDNQKDEPSMVEFWDQADPKVRELRGRVEKFHETVRYGDPLLVVGSYGKGKTLAYLSTAGEKWSDWAGDSPGSGSYPGFIVDLQRFLASQETGANLTVGSPQKFELDSTRYLPRVHVSFQPEVGQGAAAKPADAKNAPGQKAGVEDLGEVSGKEAGGRIEVAYQGTQRPGVYYFDLTERSDMGGEPKIEHRAFAYNVDTLNESDLKRSPQNEVARIADNVSWQMPGTPPPWAKRQADLSESGWFYLLFLIILVAEQALAVHLSFHLKGNEAQLPATVARPQAA